MLLCYAQRMSVLPFKWEYWNSFRRRNKSRIDPVVPNAKDGYVTDILGGAAVSFAYDSWSCLSKEELDHTAQRQHDVGTVATQTCCNVTVGRAPILTTGNDVLCSHFRCCALLLAPRLSQRTRFQTCSYPFRATGSRVDAPAQHAQAARH
jgi:hypothetical protein